MNFKKLGIIFFTGFLFFTACGKKSPPIPIEESMPKNPEIKIYPALYGANLFVELPFYTKKGYPLLEIKKLIIKIKGPNKEKVLEFHPFIHSAARTFPVQLLLESGKCYRFGIRIVKNIFVETPFFWTERYCFNFSENPEERNFSQNGENLQKNKIH